MPENCRAGSWEAWASHLHLRSDTSTVRLLPATSAGTLSGFSNLIHSGQSQTRDSLSQTCSFLIFPILVHGKLYVFHYLGWNSHPSFSHIPPTSNPSKILLALLLNVSKIPTLQQLHCYHLSPSLSPSIASWGSSLLQPLPLHRLYSTEPPRRVLLFLFKI